MRMEKVKNLIEKWTTRFKKELRGKLDALPPKARLGIVLTAFAAFTSLCLYMTATAHREVGPAWAGEYEPI